MHIAVFPGIWPTNKNKGIPSFTHWIPCLSVYLYNWSSPSLSAAPRASTFMLQGRRYFQSNCLFLGAPTNLSIVAQFYCPFNVRHFFVYWVTDINPPTCRFYIEIVCCSRHESKSTVQCPLLVLRSHDLGFLRGLSGPRVRHATPCNKYSHSTGGNCEEPFTEFISREFNSEQRTT